MFKKLFDRHKNDPAEIPAERSAAPEVPEDEIVAVIAAAVAALYRGTGITPKIRGVRPVSGSRPIWAVAGLLESTRPFLP